MVIVVNDPFFIYFKNLLIGNRVTVWPLNDLKSPDSYQQQQHSGILRIVQRSRSGDPKCTVKIKMNKTPKKKKKKKKQMLLNKHLKKKKKKKVNSNFTLPVECILRVDEPPQGRMLQYHSDISFGIALRIRILKQYIGFLLQQCG